MRFSEFNQNVQQVIVRKYLVLLGFSPDMEGENFYWLNEHFKKMDYICIGWNLSAVDKAYLQGYVDCFFHRGLKPEIL